jgi:PAS domain S-box-containing protein
MSSATLNTERTGLVRFGQRKTPMEAPIPPNERERLLALDSTTLLDTPPEESFDRICRIAAQFFQAPIAAISLVAEDRQFFKSVIGTDLRQTCRQVAFCAHTILSDDPFVVLDARTDPRFGGNPLVTGKPGIRFYCGAPIISREGLRLGSVCVIDTEPRNTVSESLLSVLMECAAQASSEIEHRRSDRERLRESDEILRAISCSCPVGIFRADLCGRVSYANSRVQEMWDMSEDQIKGTGWVARLHPDDAPLLLDGWRQANTQRIDFDLEYRLIRPNGQIRWIHGRSSVVHGPDGIPVGTIGTVDDVTERRLLEEERRRQEELIQRAAEEREKAREAAEQANQTKTIFLANASHELRTPLNGVLGMTELLLQTRLNTEQAELTESIRQSGTALLTLVNDLLDLSRIESGKLQYQPAPFQLRQTVRTALQMVSQDAHEKELELTAELDESVPEWLMGDEGRIRQILVNYLNNAVKFTDSGSVSLAISASAEASSSVTLLISVRDTGAGISPELRENVFKLFWQADASAARKHGGLGLGLALSARLAELMNGSVGVESTPEVGSTFWLKIPLRVAFAPCGASGAPESAASLKGLRVLVAEDNAINQKLITKALAKLGCEAFIAPNGRAAVQLYERGEYDLVLMDCQMPELDGYEATRQIRKRQREESRPAIPIVALTAHGMASDRDKCLEAGMDDHLVKPLKLEALQKALEFWSGKRHRQ